ncbi:MAG: hypothetical protein H7A25_22905 [Leptospiraceae bacterium]|nr:hypothetical protein [Leptospiraceae bacterium]
MKHLLKLTALSVLLLSLTACPKKKEDDNTTTLLLLLSMQQQQAASTEASKTAALAQHPGCTKLNTASTTSQTLQYAQDSSSAYQANIQVSLNAGQKLVITATKGNLPLMSSSSGYSIAAYNLDSCTTADFTRVLYSSYSQNVSISNNSTDRTKIEITATKAASYNFEITVTDVVTAGGVITYQIQ